jgi:hypothetical protein
VLPALVTDNSATKLEGCSCNQNVETQLSLAVPTASSLIPEHRSILLDQPVSIMVVMNEGNRVEDFISNHQIQTGALMSKVKELFVGGSPTSLSDLVRILEGKKYKNEEIKGLYIALRGFSDNVTADKYSVQIQIGLSLKINQTTTISLFKKIAGGVSIFNKISSLNNILVKFFFFFFFFLRPYDLSKQLNYLKYFYYLLDLNQFFRIFRGLF